LGDPEPLLRHWADGRLARSQGARALRRPPYRSCRMPDLAERLTDLQNRVAELRGFL